MTPTAAENVAGLATDGLDQLSPLVLTIGASGVVLVVLFTVYAMVTTAIRSKGKRVG